MKRVDIEKKYWDDKAKSKNIALEMHDPEISLEVELSIIAKESPIHATKNLEIGCGIGRLLIPLSRYRRDTYWCGVDISERLIRIAGETARLLNADGSKPPNLELIDNDGRTLPLEDNYFDFIYSVTVFQHIDKEGVESYFKEVGRVLAENGVFLFQFIEGDEHEPFSHHYPYPYISWLLDKSGLTIDKEQYGLIYPEWTWITAKKINKRLLKETDKTAYEPMPSRTL